MKHASGWFLVVMILSLVPFLSLVSSQSVFSQQAGVRVIVTPNPAEVEPGGTIQFTAQVRDKTGAILSVAPEWRVIPEKLGSIDANGLFTASSERGKGIVRAAVKIDDKTWAGNALLRVGRPPGKTLRVVVHPKRANVEPGGTAEFKAEILSPAGTTVNATLEWKVIPEAMGSITQQGIFTAGATNGECKVLAVASTETEKAFDQAIVSIGKPGRGPRMLVKINPKHAQLELGGTQQFTAEVRGQDGALIPDAVIEWRVVPDKLGSITGTGLFTAGSVAMAGQVIAQTELKGRGKAFDAATVMVGKPGHGPGARLMVRPPVARLEPNATQQFTAELVLAGGETRPVTPTWKVVPEKMGYITPAGLFTAGTTPGEARVVAEAETDQGKLTDAAMVTIGTGQQQRQGDYRIEIKPLGPVRVRSSATVQFQAKIYFQGQLVDKPVTWSLRPPALGSITPSGVFTAGQLSPGRRAQAGPAGEVIATIQTDLGPRSRGVQVTVVP
ncbi:MAG: hypothetical protein QME66_09000 [Candidatus Eisenbacteria bacterium]|nr:hypothetical protein [Candidatus Eisenbacteria bacterium]